MIISASRRTDIPAFYSEWFFNRVREGFVVTRNPFNADQMAKWRLDPEAVDAIVFWTKDPAPMLGRLRELDERGFSYYFQFTLTPYGRDVEPGVRGKGAVADTFRRLAEAVGPERVIWRYDPIFLGDAHTEAWHAERFGGLADALRGGHQLLGRGLPHRPQNGAGGAARRHGAGAGPPRGDSGRHRAGGGPCDGHLRRGG